MVEWKKLGEVCQFLKGRSLSKNDVGLGESQIILYGELYTTYGDYITNIKSRTSLEKAREATKLQYNDLVLPVSSTTKDANIGKVSIIKIKEEVSLSGDAIILRNSFNPEFLMYFINSSLFEKEKLSCVHGTTIMHLSPTKLSQKYIPIPPLAEQERIVETLDTFTESIENLKEQIAQRRKQYEHYRDQLLDLEGKEGVEMKTISEVFDTRNGYTPSTSNNQFWEGGTIPWFKMEDIRDNGRILNDSNLHITPSAIKGKGLFKANSIILATSATIGEHALITVEYLSNQRFTNIYPKEEYREKVDMKFIYYYMFIVDEWCKQHINQGGFASVDMGGLYNLPIPVPSLSEQQRIVSILDTFETSIRNLEAQLKEREKQYEYYRNKLFTFE